jgi:16S rRNA (guanine527-N7)-methyltransferase
MSDLASTASRYALQPGAAASLARILETLAREPDPQTAVPPEGWVDVHVADSLAALELDEVRQATRIADVGAGAGFPGLPLAVALPRARVDLIESAGRKTAVIERLIDAAGLDNARAVHARVEDWARGEGRGAYDAVAIRAVGSLAVLAEYAAPLLRDGGALVAWKGVRDRAEEAAAAAAAPELGLEPGDIRPVEPYEGSRSRHLHLYLKVRPTPERFPRRPGMASKRPLA